MSLIATFSVWLRAYPPDVQLPAGWMSKLLALRVSYLLLLIFNVIKITDTKTMCVILSWQTKGKRLGLVSSIKTIYKCIGWLKTRCSSCCC